jgi:hypothetical protein
MSVDAPTTSAKARSRSTVEAVSEPSGSPNRTTSHDPDGAKRPTAGVAVWGSYQCTPRMRCASATASVEAFSSSAGFSPSFGAPRARAESGKTL